MVDIAQRQRTTFPTLDNAVDAAAKYRSDYDRANTEYNRFHARSDPAAQLAEQAAYADPSRMNPTFVNARNPRVFRNTQWSPNYPGNKYTTQFTVGSSGGTGGLESLPRGEYYNNMKDTYNEEVINAEEEGDGIFNNPYYNRDNPLMDELFRLNRERRMEELRRRMMEENRRLQMELSNEMLMNPNKFNLMPGTGNLNPIFGGDPYWNI